MGEVGTGRMFMMGCRDGWGCWLLGHFEWVRLCSLVASGGSPSCMGACVLRRRCSLLVDILPSRRLKLRKAAAHENFKFLLSSTKRQG